MFKLFKKALPFAITIAITSTISVMATNHQIDTLFAKQLVVSDRGVPRGTLFVSDSESAAMLALNGKGKSNILLGSGYIAFHDAKGRLRLMMGVNEDGIPVMATLDEKGVPTKNLL